jgi:hypothetical protein
LWRADALLLVKGKVELRDGKIQVLCDSAEEYQISTDDGRPKTEDVSSLSSVNGRPSPVQVAMPDAEEAAIAEVDPFVEDNASMPPLPEEVNSGQSTVNGVQSSVVSNQEAGSNGHAEKSNRGNGGAPNAKSNGAKGGTYAPVAEPARVAESSARYHPTRHLRIFLSRTNDYDEDVHRMRELLSVLSSVDGRDRFTFYVPNPQGVVQLDFPNHSTSYAQVQSSLDEMLGQWGTLEVQ